MSLDRVEINSLKLKLPDYLLRYHNIGDLKHSFHCFNPEHPDIHPSMRYYAKGNVCKCFSCGACYDIFDLVGIDYNLSSFKDKIAKVQELYLEYTKVTYEDKEDNNKMYDYTKYYDRCYNNKNKSDYLLNRGISKKLIDKYHIGYDSERQRIIFPINKNCYFARSTVNSDKLKSPGKSDIWNKQLLYDDITNSHIYITEGIIDSLSLETIDSNIKTISINGVSNIYLLVNAIKETKYNGVIIIVFDDDNAGNNATKRLREELAKINVDSFSLSLIPYSKDCKDINDALVNHKSSLQKNIFVTEDMLSSLIDKKNTKRKDEVCLE